MIDHIRRLYQNCLPPGAHDFLKSVCTGAGIGGATAAAAFVMNKIGAANAAEQTPSGGFAEREARRYQARSHHGHQGRHRRS